jgi:hypothetical protein
MPLPRSTSVNLKSRRSLRKRTSCRTDPSFPERRSLSPYLVLPKVCVMPATTLPLSRSVPHDSWLKRRPNGKLPTNGTRLLTKLPRQLEIWMSTWTMEFPPPHQPELQRANEEVLSTVHPDPIDNLSVWLQGNRISLPSNFENSLSENQTGWQRLQSQIDMYPSRDRNGCWLERERVERQTEDSWSMGIYILFLVYSRFIYDVYGLYVYSALCYRSRRALRISLRVSPFVFMGLHAAQDPVANMIYVWCARLDHV